jgi:hypothetical protein
MVWLLNRPKKKHFWSFLNFLRKLKITYWAIICWNFSKISIREKKIKMILNILFFTLFKRHWKKFINWEVHRNINWLAMQYRLKLNKLPLFHGLLKFELTLPYQHSIILLLNLYCKKSSMHYHKKIDNPKPI